MWHLGGRDHLHRLGDLGGVLDRFDAAADVAEVGHGDGGILTELREADGINGIF
jgi:hypothetical protein